MSGDRYRLISVCADGDDALEADLATLIAAFRDMAHPVSSLSREAGSPDGWDGAEQRVVASRAAAVPPSRFDAWSRSFETVEV